MSTEKEMLNELKKIRELLEPKPAPPAAAPKTGVWNEFVDFLSKYKVMGLAVAFIIGLYLGTVIQSLVKDILMPAIGLAIPGMTDLATLAVTVNDQIFGIGAFLVSVITFVIVAFVIFIIVKITKKWGVE